MVKVCETCGKEITLDTQRNCNCPRVPLVEGEDYQMEDGMLVFTKKFHLKRGYCCKNSCRHCPY